ncbi:aspartyl-phosphate phosphatase Spo0E family protein [Bacillota bacterium LX-D]|nr:aspartyl-phosphate phosphatase Spo0E family protein [Bacillota bacterium LX-D]
MGADCYLYKRIKSKSDELTRMAINSQRGLLDQEIYQKSCELDELIVRYMRIKRSRS